MLWMVPIAVSLSPRTPPPSSSKSVDNQLFFSLRHKAPQEQNWQANKSHKQHWLHSGQSPGRRHQSPEQPESWQLSQQCWENSQGSGLGTSARALKEDVNQLAVKSLEQWQLQDIMQKGLTGSSEI